MTENQWLKDLEPFCMLKDLLRNIWLVILAAVIFMGGVRLADGLLFRPTYTSSVTYAVLGKSGTSSSLANLSTANDTATMMSAILESDIMENRICAELGFSEMPGVITANVAGGTNLLTISARADSSQNAFLIIRAVMDCYDDYFSKIDETAVLQKISDPRVPLTPDSASGVSRHMKLAGLAGALLMILLLLWLHVKADTIQNRAAARHKLDAEVLVSIPHEKKKKGTQLLISQPEVSFYFRENLYRLRSMVETAQKEGEGATVILVTSVAASEGKSTVAANLAIALAEKNSGVLLMDLDFRNPTQASLLNPMNPPKAGSMIKLLSQNALTVNSISSAINYDRDRNLITMLETMPCDRATELISSPQMDQLIQVLRKSTNYIVLDAPPLGIFPDGSVLADLADFALLTVRQDMVSAMAINDATDVLRQGKAKLLGLVLNDMQHTATGGYGYGRGYGYGYGNGRKHSYGYGTASEHRHKSGTGTTKETDNG